MNGAAVGLAAAAFCQEGRAAEIPGQESRLLGVLRRFLVLGAAFAVGRRLLGGRTGRRVVGIPEGQGVLQRLLHAVRHRKPDIRPHLHDVFLFRGFRNTNHPRMDSQFCLAGSSPQSVKFSRLGMAHRCHQNPLSGTRCLPAQ